jgi:hypothetical protein
MTMTARLVTEDGGGRCEEDGKRWRGEGGVTLIFGELLPGALAANLAAAHGVCDYKQASEGTLGTQK